MKRFVLFFALLASVTICKAQMSGTYTVGTSGNYSSLTNAYNALVSAGINGPITLSVTSDLSGQQTLSGSVTGASTTNTITITSSTGNASSYTIGVNSNYALRLSDGVSNVIVKDITIGVATYSSQQRGVDIVPSTIPHTNIEFRNCIINSTESTTSSNYYAVYYGGNTSSYLNNIRFIKNIINSACSL